MKNRTKYIIQFCVFTLAISELSAQSMSAPGNIRSELPFNLLFSDQKDRSTKKFLSQESVMYLNPTDEFHTQNLVKTNGYVSFSGLELSEWTITGMLVGIGAGFAYGVIRSQSSDYREPPMLGTPFFILSTSVVGGVIGGPVGAGSYVVYKIGQAF